MDEKTFEEIKQTKIIITCNKCGAEYLPTENFRKCPYCGYIHDNDNEVKIETRIIE